MTNLAEFRQEMQGLMKSLMEELNVPDLRPFVCEGSPLECEVFIVGTNPATEMSIAPWEHWSDDYGFRKYGKGNWFEAYKEERRNRPLKPGRTRRNKVSRTRRRINLVIEGAHPVKCLETNIYAKPSENEDELKAFLVPLSCDEQKRLIAPFDYLLEQIKPKLVVAHGECSQEYLRQQCQTLEALGCEKWCEDHFASRGREGYTNAKAEALGCRIHKLFNP